MLQTPHISMATPLAKTQNWLVSTQSNPSSWLGEIVLTHYRLLQAQVLLAFQPHRQRCRTYLAGN